MSLSIGALMQKDALKLLQIDGVNGTWRDTNIYFFNVQRTADGVCTAYSQRPESE